MPDLESVAKARLAKNAELATAAQDAWQHIWRDIHAHAVARRPKPKSFEVHHETETVRAAFIAALAVGCSLQSSVTQARKRMTEIHAHFEKTATGLYRKKD